MIPADKIRTKHKQWLFAVAAGQGTARKATLKGLHIEKPDRITQNAAVMGGKACIRGLRVTVGMIVGQIGAGELSRLLHGSLLCLWGGR